MKKIKGKRYWAVLDKNGDVLQQEKGGQISVFAKKETAEFLAYGWIDPSEKCKVALVKIVKI